LTAALAISYNGKKAITGSALGSCTTKDLNTGNQISSMNGNGSLGVTVPTIRNIWDFEFNQYQELSAD
jgi:hypothetical protein